jgi:hypothetical protein
MKGKVSGLKSIRAFKSTILAEERGFLPSITSIPCVIWSEEAMVESYFCTKMSLKLSAAQYFALHDSLHDTGPNPIKSSRRMQVAYQFGIVQDSPFSPAASTRFANNSHVVPSIRRRQARQSCPMPCKRSVISSKNASRCSSPHCSGFLA